MVEWQPIETAPKDGRKVLVWHPGFGLDYLVMYWLEGDWREPKDGARLKSPPTHWAAVPPPPKQ